MDQPVPDDLIARLSTRAADPRRRADVIVSRFDEGVRTLDLGALVRQLGQLSGLLRQTVAANRAGQPDPEGHARALEIQRDMHTPASRDLPARASEAELARAESRLGFPLPAALRQILAEVADGGFGPGTGLFGVDRIVAGYAQAVADGPSTWGHPWPQRVLPVVDRDPGLDCIDSATGRVIGWDAEDLRERSSDRSWQRSFTEIAPSVEAWLGDWLGSKTFDEQVAERTQASMVEEARKARARIRTMSPEERRAMGLPDTGWEKVVWGGIGWDEEPGEG